jgi:NTP pyrophosphatase (non-canonical NTP hydrolase)
MKNYQLPVIAKISRWANDRNIIQGSTPIKQALKTLEECSELIESVADNDKEGISDAIGDICVTLVNQCEMQGLDFLECIEKAYDVIKDRKGRMINGKFEKEL